MTRGSGNADKHWASGKGCRWCRYLTHYDVIAKKIIDIRKGYIGYLHNLHPLIFCQTSFVMGKQEKKWKEKKHDILHIHGSEAHQRGFTNG
jgi:hypothetical protein